MSHCTWANLEKTQASPSCTPFAGCLQIDLKEYKNNYQGRSQPLISGCKPLDPENLPDWMEQRFGIQFMYPIIIRHIPAAMIQQGEEMERTNVNTGCYSHYLMGFLLFPIHWDCTLDIKRERPWTSKLEHHYSGWKNEDLGGSLQQSTAKRVPLAA